MPPLTSDRNSIAPTALADRIRATHPELLERSIQAKQALHDAAKEGRRPSDLATDFCLEDRDPASKPLPDYVWREFRESAIPDRLTELNARYYDGIDAVLLLARKQLESAQKQSSFAGSAVQKVLKNHERLSKGLWAVFGTTIDGGENTAPSAKPRIQQSEAKGFGEGKPVKKGPKYTGPAGEPALPILPWVDQQTAQEIFDRYQVEPLEGEAFWRTIKRCGIPIAIAEGFKKACSLICHGIPAISLRGIYNWHSKGEKTQLHPGLVEFATTGQQFYICFDQDPAPKTVQAVTEQIRALGKELQRRGCSVAVLCWEQSEGKGVDDAIYNAGSNGQKWLDAVVEGAVEFGEWKKNHRIPLLLAAIERGKTLGITPTRETEGRYVPDIAPVAVGTITVIQAPTGSGKTQQIRSQVDQWRATGGNVLALYSLNSLGQQTASRKGLPHIHDYGKDPASISAFESDMSVSRGAVLCFDSLHRIPGWFFNRPLLLILDEANQGIEHLTGGDTLGDRQNEIVQKLSRIAKMTAVTGAIILAEAKIFPHTLEFVKAISGCTNVIRIDHHRNDNRGTVQVRKVIGCQELYAGALKSLERGEKLLWVSTSQRNTRLVAEALVAGGYRVARIDSETNRGGEFDVFFADPDQWLEENGGSVDVLILSPSCKTGLSIEWPGFDRVYGYFPGLDPDSGLQLLARYRPVVPREIGIPAFIQTSGRQALGGTKKIAARLQTDRELALQVYAIESVESGSPDEIATAAAVVGFACANDGLRGAQKSIAYEYLCSALEQDGFRVARLEPEPDPESKALVKAAKTALVEAQEKIWRDDAVTQATAVPFDSVDKARSVKAQNCSLADQFRADKTLLIAEFPGIDFDDPEICYQTGYRDRGVMISGVRKNIDALDPDRVAAALSKSATALVAQGFNHKLPTRHLRAVLLNKSGILDLIDPDVIYQNGDAALVAVQQFAVKYRADLRYVAGIDVQPESVDTKGRTTHSAIDVVGKLLKCLGLRFLTVSRKGTAQTHRQYQIVPRFNGGSSGDGLDKQDLDQVRKEAATLWSIRLDLLRAAQSRAIAAQAVQPMPEPTKTAEPQPTATWTPTIGESVLAWDYDRWISATVTAIDSVGRWLVDLATGWDLTISNVKHLAPNVGGAA